MFEEFKNAFQRYNNGHVQLIIINLAVFVVMGVIMAWLWGRLVPSKRRAGRAAVALQLLIIVAGIAAMFLPHGVIHGADTRADGVEAVNDPTWIGVACMSGLSLTSPVRKIQACFNWDTLSLLIWANGAK